MTWILQGQRVGQPRTYPNRWSAEFAAEAMLLDIWDTPAGGWCGRTEGVEIVRHARRTAYVHGDGYVAEVVQALEG